MVGAEGCTAYLNGAKVGALPFERRDLLPVAVRVLLQCDDGLGRIHHRVLRVGPNHMSIDRGLDAALNTESRIELRSEQEAAKLLQYAERVASELDAQAALIVEGTQGGYFVVRLLRVDGSTASRTAVVIPGDPTDAELAAAVTDLLRVTALEGALQRPGIRPAPGAMWHAYRDAESGLESGVGEGRGSYWSVERILGMGLGGLGIASAVLAWNYYDLRHQYRNAVSAGATINQPRYVAEGKNAMLLGVSGALLLSASAPMLLPDLDDAPMLPWVLGGLAAASVGAGIYLTAAGEPCSRDACSGGQPDSLLGPMVLTQSLPLLAALASYLVRELVVDDQSSRVEVMQGVDGSAVIALRIVY